MEGRYRHGDCNRAVGFSIGSFVAQELTLIRPDLVRRVVLASAALRAPTASTGGPPRSWRRRQAADHLLPNASVKIYPDAAHGFLWQHHAEFAADVTEFLS